MMPLDLILIRHGESEGNVAGAWPGRGMSLITLMPL